MGKEYVKGIYYHLVYLTYKQSTSCVMLDWMKHNLESRFLGEISITSDCRCHYPYGRKEEELKSHLMKMKEDSEKSALKQHSKNEVHVSSPITSWQIDGETMETVADFIFLGSKITADGDCSQVIKNSCSLEEKV